MSGLEVYGAPWCPHCRRTKQFLEAQRVTFEYHDIDRDPAAVETLERLQDGGRTIPMVVYSDGTHAVNPSDGEVAQRLGVPRKATRTIYDLAIVGGGTAGLAAALVSTPAVIAGPGRRSSSPRRPATPSPRSSRSGRTSRTTPTCRASPSMRNERRFGSSGGVRACRSDRDRGDPRVRIRILPRLDDRRVKGSTRGPGHQTPAPRERPGPGSSCVRMWGGSLELVGLVDLLEELADL
jgi:glutaredoxin